MFTTTIWRDRVLGELKSKESKGQHYKNTGLIQDMSRTKSSRVTNLEAVKTIKSSLSTSASNHRHILKV